MSNPIKTLTLGSCILAGLGIFTTPTFAATLTSVTTDGETTVFQTRDVGFIETYEDPTYSGHYLDILSGSRHGAGGNVELNDKVDYGWNGKVGTLEAAFDDSTSIMFSSLTESDWFGPNDLANQWFTGAMSAYGTEIWSLINVAKMMGELPPGVALETNEDLYAWMSGLGVFRWLSDPNISYVTGDRGQFTFGLAGHTNLGRDYPELDDKLEALLSPISASEVVKYSLDGGASWDYVYHFGTPFDSGVISDDGFSHTGTFEFVVGQKQITEKVPEPSAILGLVGLGGVLWLGKRSS